MDTEHEFLTVTECRHSRCIEVTRGLSFCHSCECRNLIQQFLPVRLLKMNLSINMPPLLREVAESRRDPLVCYAYAPLNKGGRSLFIINYPLLSPGKTETYTAIWIVWYFCAPPGKPHTARFSR